MGSYDIKYGEQLTYSNHDVNIHSAIIECNPKSNDALLLLSGNASREWDVLKALNGEEFGYSCRPISGYMLRLEGTAPVLKRTNILRPVYGSVYECKENATADSEFVQGDAKVYNSDANRRIITYNKVVWRVPLVWLPYCVVSENLYKGFIKIYKRNNRDSDTALASESILTSYEFGQTVGKTLEILDYSRAEFPYGDKSELLKPYNITDFTEDSAQILNILDLNKFLLLILDGSACDYGVRSEASIPISSLIECLGDNAHLLTFKVILPELESTRVVCSGVDKHGVQELIFVTGKSNGKGERELIFTRKKFKDVIDAVENKNTNFGGISVKADKVHIDYIDKSVVYERAVLNELLGCGVTKKSNKISVTSQFTAGSGGLEIWGDGSLHDVKCSATGEVIIPNSVTKISKGAFSSVTLHPDLKRVVIPESVTKIERGAFTKNGYIYNRESILGSIEFVFKKPNASVIKQFMLSIDTNEASFRPNIVLQKNNAKYNSEILFSMLFCPTCYVQYIPKCIYNEDWFTYLSFEDTLKYVRTVIDFCVKAFSTCSGKGYEFPTVEKLAKIRELRSTIQYLHYMTLVPKWNEAHTLLCHMMTIVTSSDKHLIGCNITAEELKLLTAELERGWKAYVKSYSSLLNHTKKLVPERFIEITTSVEDVEKMLNDKFIGIAEKRVELGIDAERLW